MKKTFDRFKNILLRQQKKVEDDLKNLEDDDPVMNNGGPAESSEPGTDSWMADTHSRVVAIKQSLQDMLEKTRKSLMNLNSGKYGKCEKCGKPIELARLAVMPTATLCIADSKKPTKR